QTCALPISGTAAPSTTRTATATDEGGTAPAQSHSPLVIGNYTMEAAGVDPSLAKMLQQLQEVANGDGDTEQQRQRWRNKLGVLAKLTDRLLTAVQGLGSTPSIMMMDN